VELYDAHNHLQDDWLQPYAANCFQALGEIGLKRAVVNGTTESDWGLVAALAKSYPWVLPSYGLHPWFIAQRTDSWESRLQQQLNAGGYVGEIGLDRWKRPFDWTDQQQVFRQQLRIATQRDLPVTIHCLQAWGALLDILREEPLSRSGFLLHAYGGPREMVKEFSRLGAYFSFSGYFLHERKQERREVFRMIPPDRLLVETDAPAMPLPRGKEIYPLPPAPEGQPINHPANLGVVYEGLAEIRGMKIEDLAQLVAGNFGRLFGRMTQ
jgi:TatD DNase family protein